MKGKIIIKPFSALFIFLLFALLLFLWKNLGKEGFGKLKDAKLPKKPSPAMTASPPYRPGYRWIKKGPNGVDIYEKLRS